MVRFIINYDQIRHRPDNHPQINFAVGCFCDRLRPQELLPQVPCWRRSTAFINSVDIGQEQIAGRRDMADFILHMNG